MNYYIRRQYANGGQFYYEGIDLDDNTELDPNPTTWAYKDEDDDEEEDEESFWGWEDALAPRGKYAQVKYRDGRCYLIDLDEISAGNGWGIIRELPSLDEDYYPYLPQKQIFPTFERYSEAKAFADEYWCDLTLCIIEGKNGEDEGKVDTLVEAPQVSWWYHNYEESYYDTYRSVTEQDKLSFEAAEFILDNSDEYEDIMPGTDEYDRLRDQIERELRDSLPRGGLLDNEVYILDLDFGEHKFVEIDCLDLDSANGYDDNGHWWRISVKPGWVGWRY